LWLRTRDRARPVAESRGGEHTLDPVASRRTGGRQHDVPGLRPTARRRLSADAHGLVGMVPRTSSGARGAGDYVAGRHEVRREPERHMIESRPRPPRGNEEGETNITEWRQGSSRP